LSALIVGLGCYVAQQTSFVLQFAPAGLPTIWLPGAVILSVYMLVPKRKWWLYTIAVFIGLVSALTSTLSLRFAIVTALLTIACRMAAGMLWGRWNSERTFQTVSNLMPFLIVAALLVPAVGSLLAAWVILANGWQLNFWELWRRLFLAGVLSHIILTPVIFEATLGGFARLRQIPRKRWLEAATVVALLAVIEWWVLPMDWTPQRAHFNFALLPILLWSTMRLGSGVTSIALLALVWISSWKAIYGPVILAGVQPATTVLSLQLFFIAISVALLFLATIVRERSQAVEALCASERIAKERLVQLSSSITELKKTEEALRFSEEMYRDIVESQTELVSRYLPDTTLTFVNEAYCRFFKKTRSELIGSSLLKQIPESSHELAINYIQSLLANPRAEVIEHEVLLPDGTTGWQQWVDHVIQGPDGKVKELQGIGRDITARKRAEEELQNKERKLRESHRRVQELAGGLITAQETERTRIARELHDGISQQLAVLSIGLSDLQRRLPEAATQMCSDLIRLQRETHQLADDVRRLSYDLHPGVLQHAGLVPALRFRCDEFSRHQDGVPTTFRVAEGLGAVPANVSLCLYRVAQEALRNIVRHAKAGHVWVSLSRENGALTFKVSDDGQGFDSANAKATVGLGLLSIEERVRLIGGTVSIDSTVNGGTQLCVRVPQGSGSVPSARSAGA